jgi:hypothetical protein
MEIGSTIISTTTIGIS